MSLIKSVESAFAHSRGEDRYLTLIFVAYLLLLAVAVWNHEPWMDEAQSWLLVSDVGTIELFTKYLRYEGHPGLWYLILTIPAKLGFPYFSLNILSALISALGVFLFLRRSPFPFFIKALFPFSYFVFFQYAVVARSYCLIPLFLFLIAVKYRKRFEQPILYSLLLCLFANVSAHTFLISGGLMATHLLEVARDRRESNKRDTLRQSIGFAMFAVTSLLIVATLLPPSDQLFAGESNFSLSNFVFVNKWLLSGALLMDESSRFSQLQAVASLLIILVTFVWLRRKKLALIYLFPLFLNLILFAVKYRNLWHEGILFFLWIFVLWISFAERPSENSSRLGKIVAVLIAVVLSVQIYWTAHVVRNDFFHNYSGGYEVAQAIKDNDLTDKRILMSGWKSISILPYFDKNIFYNLNENSGQRFWRWSIYNETFVGFHSALVERVRKDQPDVVIFASDHIEPNTTLELEGYVFAGEIKGNLFWKTGIYEPDTYWIFLKAE